MKSKVFRILLVVLLLFAMLSAFAACSAKAGSSDIDGTSAPEMHLSMANKSLGADSTSRIIVTEDRLIVYTVDIALTAEDHTASAKKMREALTTVGGYESHSDEHSAGVYEYSFRVPTVKLNDFLSEIEGTGKVERKEVSTVDITDRYVNAQSEKEALEFKKATLEALLAEATTFAEKVDITERILDVSRQIDNYSKVLTDYKKEADYSTVNVTLYSEGDYEEEEKASYWEKLGEVFFGSGKSIGVVFGGILTVLVAVLPYFALIAAGFGLYVLVKFIVCRIRKVPFTLFKKLRDYRAKRKAEEAAAEQALKAKAAKALPNPELPVNPSAEKEEPKE